MPDFLLTAAVPTNGPSLFAQLLPILVIGLVVYLIARARSGKRKGAVRSNNVNAPRGDFLTLHFKGGSLGSLIQRWGDYTVLLSVSEGRLEARNLMGDADASQFDMSSTPYLSIPLDEAQRVETAPFYDTFGKQKRIGNLKMPHVQPFGEARGIDTQQAAMDGVDSIFINSGRALHLLAVSNYARAGQMNIVSQIYDFIGDAKGKREAGAATGRADPASSARSAPDGFDL